jgi:hypothetical protein
MSVRQSRLDLDLQTTHCVGGSLRPARAAVQGASLEAAARDGLYHFRLLSKAVDRISEANSKLPRVDARRANARSSKL